MGMTINELVALAHDGKVRAWMERSMIGKGTSEDARASYCVGFALQIIAALVHTP